MGSSRQRHSKETSMLTTKTRFALAAPSAKSLLGATLLSLACLLGLAAPARAQTINVVDVGGALALLQDAIEPYKTVNPAVKLTFTNAPPPNLPGKLKAIHAAHLTTIALA